MIRSSETKSSPDSRSEEWSREQLIGFREGRRDALTYVYRSYVSEIAKLLREGFSFDAQGSHRRFIGYSSAFELQDALHETFRRAFEPRARTAYDGLRPYGPYLKSIARNLVLQSFRRRERAFPELDRLEAANPLQTQDLALAGSFIQGVSSTIESSPDALIYRDQVKSIVQEFLAELNESDRELLRLRFIEGLSQRQTADKLEIGRQSIRSRESKLRSQLFAYLHATGESREGISTWPLVISLLIEVLS